MTNQEINRLVEVRNDLIRKVFGKDIAQDILGLGNDTPTTATDHAVAYRCGSAKGNRVGVTKQTRQELPVWVFAVLLGLILGLSAMSGCCAPCPPTVTPLPRTTPMLDSASNDVSMPTYTEEENP